MKGNKKVLLNLSHEEAELLVEMVTKRYHLLSNDAAVKPAIRNIKEKLEKSLNLKLVG